MTINHAEQAQRFLDAGRDYDLRKAQVHATLAVAEQQRIANLIAYVAKWTDDELLDVDADIRKGLGL